MIYNTLTVYAKAGQVEDLESVRRLLTDIASSDSNTIGFKVSFDGPHKTVAAAEDDEVEYPWASEFTLVTETEEQYDILRKWISLYIDQTLWDRGE